MNVQVSPAFEEHENHVKSIQRVESTGEYQPTLSTPPVVETDFAETADGSLIEMIEDPEDSARTLLAVYKGGEVRYTSRFQSGDRVL
jgi:hypothetical protein